MKEWRGGAGGSHFLRLPVVGTDVEEVEATGWAPWGYNSRCCRILQRAFATKKEGSAGLNISSVGVS